MDYSENGCGYYFVSLSFWRLTTSNTVPIIWCFHYLSPNYASPERCYSLQPTYLVNQKINPVNLRRTTYKHFSVLVPPPIPTWHPHHQRCKPGHLLTNQHLNQPPPLPPPHPTPPLPNQQSPTTTTKDITSQLRLLQSTWPFSQLLHLLQHTTKPTHHTSCCLRHRRSLQLGQAYVKPYVQQPSFEHMARILKSYRNLVWTFHVWKPPNHSLQPSPCLHRLGLPSIIWKKKSAILSMAFP